MKHTRKNLLYQGRNRISPEEELATLFTPQEMEQLILKIPSPRTKQKKLFIPGTHNYRKFRYTINETAKFLGITLRVMKALRDQGEIKFTRSGDKILFYAGDIHRFLQTCIKRQET